MSNTRSVLLTHPIRFHSDKGRWLVPSQSQPNFPVLVDMDEYDGVGWCCCEDFQFRKQPALERGEHLKAHLIVSMGMLEIFQCRHIRAVLKEMARLEKKGSK